MMLACSAANVAMGFAAKPEASRGGAGGRVQHPVACRAGRPVACLAPQHGNSAKPITPGGLGGRPSGLPPSHPRPEAKRSHEDAASAPRGARAMPFLIVTGKPSGYMALAYALIGVAWRNDIQDHAAAVRVVLVAAKTRDVHGLASSTMSRYMWPHPE